MIRYAPTGPRPGRSVRTLSGALLGSLLLLGGGCPAASGPPSPPTTVRGAAMQTISSSDELLALNFQVDGLLRQGGEPRLAAQLLPGRYGVSSHGAFTLKLGGPSPDPSRLTVELMGDPAGGTVLAGLPLTVHARELTLRRLSFVDAASGTAEHLSFGIGQGALFDALVLRGNRTTAPFTSTLLQLTAGSGGPARTVAVRESWFVGNRQHAEAVLFATRPTSAGVFAELSFTQCVFAGNDLTTAVLPLGVAAVSFTDSFVQLDRGTPPAAPPAAPSPPGRLVPGGPPRPGRLPPGAQPPVASRTPNEAAFVRRPSPDQRIAFSGCTLILDRWERLVTAPPVPPGVAGQPVLVEGCQVWLTDPTAPREPPPLIRLVGGEVRDGSALSVTGAAFGEALERLTAGDRAAGAAARRELARLAGLP